ncbi:MAG: ABC transporter substrate-binding protein [Pseudomonadota bacterium]
MRIDPLNRRRLMALLAAAGSTAAARPSFALSAGEAENLVNALTADIFKAINSGKAGASLYRDFERLFGRYADVNVIAASSLGVARRQASSSQLRAYTDAFSGYIARKYGKRFREFIGAEVNVRRSQKTQRGFLVTSDVKLRGSSPFVVQWQVSDASGRTRVFDLIIEGISMLRLEREEIGQMLDRRGGNIDRLINDLRTAG